MKTAIYWFTLDLRLHDLPGLAAAFRQYDRVVPLFVLDRADPWYFGGASQWWLHHSLASLDKTIAEHGGKLVLREGQTVAVLQQLVEETGAEGVYFSRAYESWLAACQQDLVKTLAVAAEVKCKRYAGRLLLEPDEILNQQGKPFQVFTPYYKHCLRKLAIPGDPPPNKPNWYNEPLESEALNKWALLPKRPNWAKGFAAWQPGEAGARHLLLQMLDLRLTDYPQARDLPAVEGTSELSPHLHFGEISPRQIWRTTSQQNNRQGSAEPFLRQLIWREFSFYLLHHWPHTPTQPFRPQFKAFPWDHNANGLKAWQCGETGYPIVDAGMRQLWQTGWMHNRVRMIVASFLTKHLRIHWLKGAEWFWDTLVDADLANNTMGWQWVAGCGADAAPYFRIFNPVLQGEKFDKQGDYIRTWVPELTRLPSRYIHQPWQAPEAVLQAAQLKLGRDYPLPIVAHQVGRAAALQAYDQVKQAANN